MNSNTIKNHSSGISLLEALLALGILSIVSLAISSVLMDSLKSTKIIEEKLEISEFQRKVFFSGSNDLCRKFFTDSPSAGTFSTASFPPTEIVVDSLYFSPTDTVALASNSMKLSSAGQIAVERIFLNSIVGSGSSYRAQINIQFKDGVMPRRNIQTTVPLNTVIAGSNTVVTGCGNSTGFFNMEKSPIGSLLFRYNTPGSWQYGNVSAQCPVGTILVSCMGCIDGTNTCAPTTLAMSVADYWVDTFNSEAQVNLVKVDFRTCSLNLSMVSNGTSGPVYDAYSNRAPGLGSYYRVQADCLK